MLQSNDAITDNVNVYGKVRLTLCDARTGAVKVQRVSNLVVTNGKQWIARRMSGSQVSGGSPTAMKWIELGRGSAAATGSNVNLQTTVNVSGIRKIYTTCSIAGQTWSLFTNWGTSDANTSNLKEAGIFATSTHALNTAPGMLARATFSAINKTNADTLKIEWDIRIS